LLACKAAIKPLALRFNPRDEEMPERSQGCHGKFEEPDRVTERRQARPSPAAATLIQSDLLIANPTRQSSRHPRLSFR
jgi:hypothetical protein